MSTTVLYVSRASEQVFVKGDGPRIITDLAIAYIRELAVTPSENMKQRLGFITIISVLYCCTIDNRLEKYEDILDASDRIDMFKRVDSEWKLVKEIAEPDALQDLKDILKRKIEPEAQMKFIADTKFVISERGKNLGQVLIRQPFANFSCDNFGFGFRLSYGIRMYPGIFE